MLADPLSLRKAESFGTDRCGPDVTYATTVKGKKTRQRYAAVSTARATKRRRSLRGGELSLPAASLPITAAFRKDCAEPLVVLWSPSLVDPAHRVVDHRSSIATSSTIELVSREFTLSQSGQFRKRLNSYRDDKRST